MSTTCISKDQEVELSRLSLTPRIGPKRAALVGCGKSKRQGSHPARQLYTGQLFQASLAYAERRFNRTFDRTYILSAKFGLLGLDEAIGAYDCTLSARDDEWGEMVVRQQLANRYDRNEPLELVVFAGRNYVDPLRRMLPEFPVWTISEPLAGMGIGHRLQWFRLQGVRA